MPLPESGTIAVFGGVPDGSLPAIAADRLQIISPNWMVHRALGRSHAATKTAPDGDIAACIVQIPRARALAHALIHQAAALAPDGWIIVDGAKTDGVDSILKAVKSRIEIDGTQSKAHGKVFWFRAAPVFDDWASPGPTANRDGYMTIEGVFSADGIDPASAALVAALPSKLGPHVTDLGGGWGYLTAEVLKRDGVTSVDLVEVDHNALACARLNVADDRVRFHWDDATTWQARQLADTIVMNPPFHVGRSGDPGLGQAFITHAATCLKPTGQLWMVANRHLPYEATLETLFGVVEDLGGGSKFKILRASKPKRTRR
ncbi:class I SAM-dependent methyltransferase [Pseudoprimorskyibacter insulae]|uniref:class I SAM-dependent methyltransferase n=1 Tax=Pseudoprimorskyibacter insulae TaxID=1695997 RepID=UPI001FE97D28|nr:class I SAM-dependent methyltransferase [Pseudoprimorskyibacter insulae]